MVTFSIEPCIVRRCRESYFRHLRSNASLTLGTRLPDHDMGS